MFRLWGKIWKDNRMLQDTVVCDDSMIPEPTRSFTDLRKSVIRWIWEILFGWMPQCGIQKA